MGNCFGYRKDDQNPIDEEDKVEKATGVATSTATSSSSKPSPQVFAIMRNGHEVIRGNMVDIDTFIEDGDLDKAIESYHNLAKWEAMHKLMEEGNNGDNQTPKGVFSILDERFQGIAQLSGLRSSHVDLDESEAKVEEAVEARDLEKLKEVFQDFKDTNEAHMKKEEEIMESKVMEMKKSGVNMAELMKDEILALVVNSPDFQFFVQHATSVLERHHNNMPRARVFSHALCKCASEEEWEIWKGWIKESVSEGMFEEIVNITG